MRGYKLGVLVQEKALEHCLKGSHVGETTGEISLSFRYNIPDMKSLLNRLSVNYWHFKLPGEMIIRTTHSVASRCARTVTNVGFAMLAYNHA